MSNLSLIERSSEILTKYYENDIQPFLDAMHPEILWIGPGGKPDHPRQAEFHRLHSWRFLLPSRICHLF